MLTFSIPRLGFRVGDVMHGVRIRLRAGRSCGAHERFCFDAEEAAPMPGLAVTGIASRVVSWRRCLRSRRSWAPYSIRPAAAARLFQPAWIGGPEQWQGVKVKLSR
jgi:hypothetical protein